MRRSPLTWVAVGLAAVLLASCGSSGSSDSKGTLPSTPSSAPAAIAANLNITSDGYGVEAGAHIGGEATLLEQAEVTSLDPVKLANSVPDGYLAQGVFDYLVYTENGTVKGGTAKSLSSIDGLKWTLVLHPDITFTDGTPYDAEAVKFNILRLQDPANSAIRAAMATAIAEMNVIDAVTLEFVLKAPNVAFPSYLAFIPFVGSPTAIKALGDGFAEAPVGAGPFVIQSRVRDGATVLVRNPNYWNAPLPYLDKLTIRPVPDDEQRVNSVCTGDAQIARLSSTTSIVQLEGRNCGELTPVGANGGYQLVMNMRSAPFDDLRLRQAVGMALNLDDLTTVAQNGLVDPITSVFTPDSPFYDADILQEGYDAARAQQLFDEVAADTGGPIKFSLTAFNLPPHMIPAEYIQTLLNGYDNVEVSLVPEAVSAHISNTVQGNFEMSLYTAPFVDPDPVWTGVFLCDGKPNWAGFCDPRFDAAVKRSQETLDSDERIAAIGEAQKVLYEQLPVFYVLRYQGWILAAPQIENIRHVGDAVFLVSQVRLAS